MNLFEMIYSICFVVLQSMYVSKNGIPDKKPPDVSSRGQDQGNNPGSCPFLQSNGNKQQFERSRIHSTGSIERDDS